MSPAIGIDLGTTNSCIAFLEQDEPRVIPNLEGLPITPSVISFTSSGELLVGQVAQRQAMVNPEMTITSVKRLIGRKFRSDEVRRLERMVNYRLNEASNGDVLIEVGDRWITPQEVSAHILDYMKKCAETWLGEKVTEAVVAVPAHFDEHQRQATVDAARISGLNVLRVINEPTAASLAYRLGVRQKANVAVFDMGGGTFDITILEMDEGIFHILATSGDTYLGGQDFDDRVAGWLEEEFGKEHGLGLASDKLARQRIMEASERAKKELSYASTTEINLPFLHWDGRTSKHLRRALSREFLEDLTLDLVQKAIDLIEKTLADSRLGPEDINDILLVGGQTRMPLIRRMITDFFHKPPLEHINPDEIVALGASVQAGRLLGTMKDVPLLLDVTPLSLGIAAAHDGFEVIIPKNTIIPAIRTRPFTTVEDNQRRVRIHVLQGESPRASHNRSLALFDLVGLEPAPVGTPRIDVTFAIDADGLVRVSARDVASGREQQIEAKSSSGLTAEERERLIRTITSDTTRELK